VIGRDHALSGALTGAAVASFAPALGQPVTLLDAATLIAVTAGSALLPDIDHPSATVARAFGPASMLLAHGVNRVGELVYAATATSSDRPRRDGHRTLSHTLVFALAIGLLTFGVAKTWPRWGALSVLFATLSLALRGLAGTWAHRAGWLSLTAMAAGLAWCTVLAAPGRTVSPALLAAAVTLGSFTHCLGDSCTLDACPWLWPLPIDGQRWYPIGTPRWLRFRTGTAEHDGEDWLRLLMWAALLALAGARVPGLYPLLGNWVAGLV
jgi:membrane-bound metal-dependent hydrolase YbcI (DUF457 family)